MSAEYLFARFFRFFSLIIVLIGIFLSYFNFPDNVFVHFEHGKGVGSFPKSSLFYYASGLVLLANILLMWFNRLFQQIPDASLRFPNAQAWLTNRKALNMRVENWTKITAGVFNFFMCFVLYALAMVNLEDTKKTIANYEWMLALGLGLLLLVLFWLPIRILFGGKKEGQ